LPNEVVNQSELYQDRYMFLLRFKIIKMGRLNTDKYDNNLIWYDKGRRSIDKKIWILQKSLRNFSI